MHTTKRRSENEGRWMLVLKRLSPYAEHNEFLLRGRFVYRRQFQLLARRRFRLFNMSFPLSVHRRCHSAPAVAQRQSTHGLLGNKNGAIKIQYRCHFSVPPTATEPFFVVVVCSVVVAISRLHGFVRSSKHFHIFLKPFSALSHCLSQMVLHPHSISLYAYINPPPSHFCFVSLSFVLSLWRPSSTGSELVQGFGQGQTARGD